MNEYIKRSEVFTKYFNIYGKGNFDLSLEEIARIIEILESKKQVEYLDVYLKEIYDRLYKTRMG